MLTVKNTGQVPITVNCRVDNTGANGTDHCLTGRVDVPPGANRELSVRLTRRMPESLSKRLFGMRGFPGGYQEKGGIDVAQVVALLIFVAKPTADHQFEVSGIRAAGSSPGNRRRRRRLFPLIDRYGQYIHRTGRARSRTDADFADASEAEAADLAAHPGPADWDQYGGWQAGPQARGHRLLPRREARGQVVAGRSRGPAVLVARHRLRADRDGVTPITRPRVLVRRLARPRLAVRPVLRPGQLGAARLLPGQDATRTFNFTGANLLRKYGADWKTQFAELAHRRLRSWGMNTIANWSDAEIYLLAQDALRRPPSAPAAKRHRRQRRLLGQVPRRVRSRVSRQASRKADGRRERASRPAIRGASAISSDNELSWGDDTLAGRRPRLASPARPAGQAGLPGGPARRSTTTIEQLNAAWGTTHASWDALPRATTPPDSRRPATTCRRSTRRIAETVLPRSAATRSRTADPQQLYLGCRFAWVNDRAVRAAAKYCDVVSFNRYQRQRGRLAVCPRASTSR